MRYLVVGVFDMTYILVEIWSQPLWITFGAHKAFYKWRVLAALDKVTAVTVINIDDVIFVSDEIRTRIEYIRVVIARMVLIIDGCLVSRIHIAAS